MGPVSLIINVSALMFPIWLIVVILGLIII